MFSFSKINLKNEASVLIMTLIFTGGFMEKDGDWQTVPFRHGGCIIVFLFLSFPFFCFYLKS